MANERKWFLATQAFTQNGTNKGLIKVSNVAGFYVKSQVRIISNTQPSKLLEIKRIEGTTDIYVGKIGESINDRENISAYLVADNATITLYEQNIPNIKPEDIIQAVYDREPIVAIRSILVDQYGRHYSIQNPIPVQLSNGSINIGTVNAELEVQLSHKDNYPDLGDIHDSVRIGDGVQTFTGTNTNISKYPLDVMQLNRLIRREFDDVEILTKNADGDPLTIAFRSNSNLIATATLTYDSDGDFKRIQVNYV